MNPSLKFVFFGTDEFSVAVLEELSAEHILPELVITSRDMPKGRNLVVTSPPVKIWANRHSIKCLQPEKLSSDLANFLTPNSYRLFIVASYGKIIPKSILEIPKFGSLNVHPSLLPKYRGASPLESQILQDEKEVGVSIMLLDEEMDHGPILIQEKIKASAMPMPLPVLNHTLGSIGGRILAKIISAYIEGTIKPMPQNHNEATYTIKIKKEDGLVNLKQNHRLNYLKFLAFQRWPQTYFFVQRKNKKIRVIIKDAHFSNNEFKITRVLPEAGKEMSYEDFLRGN